MRTIHSVIYLSGVLLFFLSFFGNTFPIKMTDSNGSEVEIWETGKFRHSHLALDPLLEANELVNVINVPSRYGYGQNGDGYDDYLNQTVKRFFYSIPISVGWFTILLSILFVRQIWTQKTKHGKAQYLVIAGSVFTLIAVPLLVVEFYNRAITYESYFHLGAGAYLMVLAYLLVGIALLSTNLSEI